ncbi:unnamed protein product [Sphacelaria rigidula]
MQALLGCQPMISLIDAAEPALRQCKEVDTRLPLISCLRRLLKSYREGTDERSADSKRVINAAQVAFKSFLVRSRASLPRDMNGQLRLDCREDPEELLSYLLDKATEEVVDIDLTEACSPTKAVLNNIAETYTAHVNGVPRVRRRSALERQFSGKLLQTIKKTRGDRSTETHCVEDLGTVHAFLNEPKPSENSEEKKTSVKGARRDGQQK